MATKKTLKYSLGQYTHTINGQEDWIKPIESSANIVSVRTAIDLGTSDQEEGELFSVNNKEDDFVFIDPGLMLSSDSFAISSTYYCHCKIRRNVIGNQKFTIKLMNCTSIGDNEAEDNSEYEQFIKTIIIRQGEANEWVDIDFIFTPHYEKFNTIVLSLSRTTDDFSETKKRVPVVAFLELSTIENILPKIAADAIMSGNQVNLLKIGIQSRPGLRMCINREEIYVGRTGVYEIKNGEIRVSFFSLISPAENLLFEENKNTNNNINLINGIGSSRPFDGFTIDYIYEEEIEKEV